jgi:hypothetical protein
MAAGVYAEADPVEDHQTVPRLSHDGSHAGDEIDGDEDG